MTLKKKNVNRRINRFIACAGIVRYTIGYIFNGLFIYLLCKRGECARKAILQENHVDTEISELVDYGSEHDNPPLPTPNLEKLEQERTHLVLDHINKNLKQPLGSE